MTNSNSTRKKRVLKGYVKVALISLGVFAAIAAVLMILNHWIVNITLHGEDVVYTEFGEEYTDEGAEAYFTGSIFSMLKKEVEVTSESDVDTSRMGTYHVTYTASFKDTTETKQRTVVVKDTRPPVITLNTTDGAYTVFGQEYEEEGYTAIDNVDGDLTEFVEVTRDENTVRYSVRDMSGNKAEAVRFIFYDDREAPVITLTGGTTMTVYNGEDFSDVYSAYDNADGDITDRVTVTGYVDPSTNGEYSLTYTVSDSYGNTAEVTRTVYVTNKPENYSTGDEDEKTIYLTFDDGPYQYTDELLDILAKYNVKATFFVTAAYPAYQDCIGRAYREGHTVAVHTYSHDYSYIYSSQYNYWADFNKMNAIIEQQTGSRTTMFRFPGGSSNTISSAYCSGIMTALAADADALGYQYYDWNAYSGDAGETTDTGTVYQNVINQVSANTRWGIPSVVLQHDVKGFSVAAVEDIILWGLENGYRFERLTPYTIKAHHGINN